jgi:hypothetical protein
MNGVHMKKLGKWRVFHAFKTSGSPKLQALSRGPYERRSYEIEKKLISGQAEPRGLTARLWKTV